MKPKIKYTGLFLLLATLLSTVIAISLSVDISFTIPLYIISVILIFIDDKFIDQFFNEKTPKPVRVRKDK